MLLAYLDESYCDDWFYMVAAVAEAPIQVVRLTSALDRLLAAESERLGIDLPREVHGYDLFQGAGAWRKVPLHERLAVGGKVLQAVHAAGIIFVIRGIDRAAQRRRYKTPFEPYPMILTHVMRVLDQEAKDWGVPAIITCDEIHQHDRHRAMLERHRVQGTPGFRKTYLSTVIGELEFVDSEKSAMIQAADIVAYLKHRMVSRPDVARPEQRARANLWRIIEPRVVHEYCWTP